MAEAAWRSQGWRCCLAVPGWTCTAHRLFLPQVHRRDATKDPEMPAVLMALKDHAGIQGGRRGSCSCAHTSRG